MSINVRIVKVKKSDLTPNPGHILKILDGMKAGLNMADPEYCIYLTIATDIDDEEAKIKSVDNTKLVKFTDTISGFNAFSSKGNPPRDNEI